MSRTTAAYRLGLLIVMGAATAQAQPTPRIPNGGNILQQLTPRPGLAQRHGKTPEVETRPAMKLSADVTFELRHIRITGATVYSTNRLHALVADREGTTVSLADLSDITGRITRFYRNHGYLLTRAYVPEQDIAHGTVEIAVLEGELDKVKIRKSTAIGGQALAPLNGIPVDTPLNSHPLNRALLLAADVPGIDVQSTLTPGARVGTSDLVVEVAPGSPGGASLSVNNYGSRYVGTTRANATATLNNPAGIGDQLILSLLASDQGLYYVQTDYSVPLSRLGLRVGGQFSHLYYQLGDQYDVLDASGTADVASAFLTAPLIRSRRVNLSARFQYDHQVFKDRIGVFDLDTHKTFDSGAAGLNLDVKDALGGAGISTVYAKVEHGDLTLDKLSKAQDAVTAQTAGGYTVMSYGALRLQRLSNRTSLYVAYRGQYAFDNLDSAKQMSLGGPAGVRAYAQGDVSADQAGQVTVEGRYRLPLPVPGQWQGQAFYDYGYARLVHEPYAPGDNHVDIGGAGVGLSVRLPHGVSVTSSVAWRTNGSAELSADRKSPRAWASASYRF